MKVAETAQLIQTNLHGEDRVESVEWKVAKYKLQRTTKPAATSYPMSMNLALIAKGNSLFRHA
ncbi:MAG: hypothetical protein EBQ58_03110 [Betaproteobacteria bacterium]|nr:hypothetical protein [Betaproteobacteria bacterium]